MAERSGLLVRLDGALAFLPANRVRCLVPLSRLTKIPWDSAQMALVGGEVVAVLELSQPRGVLVLCEVDGQGVALSGLSAERVGRWPESDSGVNVDGVHVPALDLGLAIAQFQKSGQPAKENAP
jgi:hypothetical protein